MHTFQTFNYSYSWPGLFADSSAVICISKATCCRSESGQPALIPAPNNPDLLVPASFFTLFRSGPCFSVSKDDKEFLFCEEQDILCCTYYFKVLAYFSTIFGFIPFMHLLTVWTDWYLTTTMFFIYEPGEAKHLKNNLTLWNKINPHVIVAHLPISFRIANSMTSGFCTILICTC